MRAITRNRTKRSFLLLLAVIPLVTVYVAHAQRFSDQVDRFTDVREISYTGAYAGMSKPTFFVGIRQAGGVLEGGRLTFMIGSMRNSVSATSWRYLQCHNVNLLVDGKPFPVAESTHEGDVLRHGVMETIRVPVTAQQLQALGEAHAIEYRICQDEYKLEQSDAEGIAQVARAIASATPNAMKDPAQAGTQP